MTNYRETASLEVRRAESARLLAKYPDHVAVVAERGGKDPSMHFLALPKDATVAELEATAAELLGVAGTKLALTVSGFTPAASTAVEDLYRHCKNVDGFLYVVCGRVGVWGSGAHVPCFGTAARGEDMWWSLASPRKED